jgi:predicted oxidoreductase
MPSRRTFLIGAVAAGVATVASVPNARAGLGEALTQTRPLKTYKLARADLVVSRIAYGNAMLGGNKRGQEFMDDAVRAMKVAYESGITFFDTADIYGMSFAEGANGIDTSGIGMAESAIGTLLRQSPGLRNKVVIQSKCALSYQGDYEIVDNSREHIVTSVDGSLRRLGIDNLDLLLLHRPDSLVQPEEVAAAFDELKRTGKVRYFGVSNFNPVQCELLQKYLHQPLVTNQIQLGLMHWNVIPHAEPGLFIRGTEGAATVDYCRLNDMTVQAYSPLRANNSGLAGFPDLLNPPPTAAPEVTQAVQLLDTVAKQHDATPAAIMLAWLLRHPAGIVPVIGSSNPKHIVESCTADRIELSRVEWYSLLEAVTKVQTLSERLT